MPRFPKARLRRFFSDADNAPNSHLQGALLEQAISLLFETIPGVSKEDTNILNVANTEEVDILFWNERLNRGLYFLEVPFLVECKNWNARVSGREIVYFKNTMQSRCCRDGILVAAHGITGNPGTLTRAHYELSVAAREGCRILVITRQEIEAFTNHPQLIDLLKQRVLEVTLRGTKTT